ncbi:HK97 family phage prohead protease [Bacillus subtilis]|uniref:HK97 family phage prohead protease n=1 Tax=Bacillus subtilis TaxID=1423 RepID=UPI00227DBD6F|nr:HK97 family phage prohead protease [Bacillus subtilis]MCY8126043.1 HK97 family phage prohead protease [Bacillus spizizenii]WBY39810.1 HK97 family phage prohead protease [Bacillus subtilis]
MTKKETIQQRRMMNIRAAEKTDTEEMIVEGYAVRFDEPTVLWEYDGKKYYEVIDKHALDGTDMSDVPFKYNHSDNLMIMAKSKSKTLQFMIDEQGLFIRASLANTTAGRDLYELIKRGDIDKMSFAFTFSEEDYDYETRTSRITKIDRLWDVAAVDIPAYDTTSISARSFYKLEKEKEQKLKRETELREKLILQTYL